MLGKKVRVITGISKASLHNNVLRVVTLGDFELAVKGTFVDNR